MYKNQITGAKSELLFEVWCLENNLECAKPILTSLPYDYIVVSLFGMPYAKVQVKSLFFDKNRDKHRCDFRSNGGKLNIKNNYRKGDVDFIAVCSADNRWLFFSWEDIQGTTGRTYTKQALEDEFVSQENLRRGNGGFGSSKKDQPI